MKLITTTAVAGALLIGLVQPGAAYEERDAKKRLEEHPIFIPTDVLMDCKVKGPGSYQDSVKDALVDRSSGQVTALLMKSGAVHEFDALAWSVEDKCFAYSETGVRKARATNASSAKAGMQRGDLSSSLGDCFLLSKVVGYPLMGEERTEDGRSETDLGSVGGAFIDTRSGHLAYLATSVGGVLGIGAESRVIPWSAVEIDRDSEGKYLLRSALTEQRLDQAPAFGKGPDNLNNPEYRDTLYSYYGADRADFEPASADDVSLVTFDRMLGASIVRETDDRDSLANLIVNPDDGHVTFALCESGSVIPVKDLRWHAGEKEFHVSGNSKQADMDPGRHVLATALDNLPVMFDGEKCGSLQDLYFDTSSGAFAYVSVNHEGVRVLPWSLIALHSEGEHQEIHLRCSRETLKAAPELDGKVGATIYSPAFRQRIDALRKND